MNPYLQGLRAIGCQAACQLKKLLIWPSVNKCAGTCSGVWTFERNGDNFTDNVVDKNVSYGHIFRLLSVFYVCNNI